MSLLPEYEPLADEEEDRRRKAEIEDMMRWQRESYFRNEPVQQNIAISSTGRRKPLTEEGGTAPPH